MICHINTISPRHAEIAGQIVVSFSACWVAIWRGIVESRPAFLVLGALLPLSFSVVFSAVFSAFACCSVPSSSCSTECSGWVADWVDWWAGGVGSACRDLPLYCRRVFWFRCFFFCCVARTNGHSGDRIAWKSNGLSLSQSQGSRPHSEHTVRSGDGKVGSNSRWKPARATSEALGYTCGHDVNEASLAAYEFIVISTGLLKGSIWTVSKGTRWLRVCWRSGLERHTIRCWCGLCVNVWWRLDILWSRARCCYQLLRNHYGLTHICVWCKRCWLSMWSAGRYVRCQAYASGPMSIPEASHDR